MTPENILAGGILLLLIVTVSASVYQLAECIGDALFRPKRKRK